MKKNNTFCIFASDMTDIMKKSVKFSVITCTYNAAGTVGSTLDSVSSQNYGDIEHIIVDGASSDDTMKIVAEKGARISRIISEPDKGLYDAMNKGINAASGDYLIFLNAGDVFHTVDTLSEVAEKINDGSMPDIIYGQTAIIDSAGSIKRMRRLKAPENLNWKSFKRGMLVCHQSFYVRREIVIPYNLNYRYSSDFDWCIKIMKQSSSFLNTEMILSNYLEEGLTTKNRRKSLMERFDIMRNHYGLIETIVFHIFFCFRLLIKH